MYSLFSPKTSFLPAFQYNYIPGKKWQTEKNKSTYNLPLKSWLIFYDVYRVFKKKIRSEIFHNEHMLSSIILLF